ncbi:MAG: 16S rRNA (adenine(1518)-N(6)/adenine(1519)-N(6))-dimethyltransferase RsmA [Prevotellaceae bacterium]|nr:16S rRNA (adenine(1518)-N(6)/adenine(1519)-N(6))-dimethyltransferase RsmA [Prevotellaceae bacterium]
MRSNQTYVKPKKFLGQHFLKDLSVAQRIAETLPLTEKTAVLEIGPGTGVLTQFLLQNPNIDLTVVELDRESVPYLRTHFPALENRIIEGDFLKLDLSAVFKEKFFIIGNYPYNISSQIFFKLLDYREQVPCLTGMIQKEVAERIAAPHGSKTYGILSVLLQAYYNVEYLFTVDERVFDPPPKVKSAVVRLTRNEVEKIDCDEVLFKTVVKTAFNQRRKTLRNSLKSLIDKDNEISRKAIFDKRPEQLSVAQFIELTNIIRSNV